MTSASKGMAEDQKIDAVAQAIYETHWRRPSPRWNEASEAARDWVRRQAVNAIEAAYRPSPEITKLTPEIVAELRQRRADGQTMKQLSVWLRDAHRLHLDRSEVWRELGKNIGPAGQ
jgi:hypothetical protein